MASISGFFLRLGDGCLEALPQQIRGIVQPLFDDLDVFYLRQGMAKMPHFIGQHIASDYGDIHGRKS